LLTLGHGTATADELAELIRGSSIQAVIDVRAFPKSRRNPQFWSDAMAQWIPATAGAAYAWEPALGGFRKPNPASANVALRNARFRAYADYMETDAFGSALATLLAQAADARVAILCSENLWWRCHRRLSADAAMLLHGVPVEHLMHDGKIKPHVPTPGVRVTDSNSLRYDVLFEIDEPPRW
jgi:uncharacterized protein (DUF488 family)